jgi:hypothetical protein
LNAKMTATAVAGWLFADLLLAFSIVALGTQKPPPRPEPAVTPTPTPTRQALEERYVTVDLTLDPASVRRGSEKAAAGLRRALDRRPELRNRKAGIVLTFGAEHDGGEAYARAINKIVKGLDYAPAPSLFAQVQTRDFVLTGAGGGAARLQIYLFENK